MPKATCIYFGNGLSRNDDVNYDANIASYMHYNLRNTCTWLHVCL